MLFAFTLIAGIDSSALLHAQTGAAGDDTLTLPYPFNDNVTDGFSNSGQQSPMFLNNPSNIESNIEYDPESHEYNITEQMGEVNYRNPSYMTFSEYYRSQFKKTTKDYWKQKAEEDNISGRKKNCSKIVCRWCCV